MALVRLMNSVEGLNEHKTQERNLKLFQQIVSVELYELFGKATEVYE